MSRAQCIRTLVAFDRRKENDYQYRVSRIGQFVNSNYDEEMCNVLRFTTYNVARQIDFQYIAAMNKALMYQDVIDKADALLVIVRGIFSEHKLRLDT